MTLIDLNDVQPIQELEFTMPAAAPGAFHLLAKPTGAICNLDCAYCFFLDKEVFYPGSNFRMSDEVLEQYIRQLLIPDATVSRIPPEAQVLCTV